MLRRLVVPATLALVVAGCGSGVQVRPEVAGDGRGAVFDSAGVCDALARVAAADRTAGQRAEGVEGWDELQPLIVASSRESADLYDEARTVAPADLAATLELVAGVTRDLADVADDAPTQAAFQRRGQRLPDFAEAQVAISELNAYTRRNCGFTLADN